MKQAINIIFDGEPGPDGAKFVEVETDNGKSIRIGEWIQKGNYWALRIDELPDDIELETTERIHNSRIDRAHIPSLSEKLSAIITWLEKNQPDVFSRGLWDVIS